MALPCHNLIGKTLLIQGGLDYTTVVAPSLHDDIAQRVVCPQVAGAASWPLDE
jgi:hypothetical protein